MNTSRTWRDLCALGAIVFSILTFAARASAAIPKKDAWYTQHYIIMQDLSGSFTAIFRSQAGRTSRTFSGRPGLLEGAGQVPGPVDYVIWNFWKENSKQPWNTDRGLTYLQRVPRFHRLRSERQLRHDASRQVVDNANRSGEDVGANRGEIWIYPYDQYFIKYTFAFRPTLPVEDHPKPPATATWARARDLQQAGDLRPGRRGGLQAAARRPGQEQIAGRPTIERDRPCASLSSSLPARVFFFFIWPRAASG